MLPCFQIQSTDQCAIRLADTQHCGLEESPEQWPGLGTPDGDAERATSCPQEACRGPGQRELERLPRGPAFTGQGTTLSPATVTWEIRVLPSFSKVLRIWRDKTHPPDQSKLTGPLVPGHTTCGQGQWDMPTHPLLVPAPLHSFEKCL